MFVHVLLAFLAAFGLFCAVWAIFGWLLPMCREGWLIYPGQHQKLDFVYIYLWLRGMGLLRCPLILMDLGVSEDEREWLARKEIELYSPEELSQGLPIGVEET